MRASKTDACWASVLQRDARADGRFFYSVRTTGVYCRPSCGARKPRREHVRFHATCEDAEKAGFRACKRCKPAEPSRTSEYAQKIAAACRRIEASGEPLTLKDLALHAGWSPFHFHRVFRSITGVTPAQYGAAHRARRVRENLKAGDTVTDAVYEAGYNSNGRFYAAADAVLGMTPSAYRSGAAGMEIRFATGNCSLGSVLVAQGERGVCAILLGDGRASLVRDLEQRFPRATLRTGDRSFEKLVAKVVAFVEAPNLRLDLPLDIRGTVFQQRVWDALRRIPVGETASYTEIAQRIGAPKSVRAVAQACGANRLAVAIPCHRVVGKSGDLSGYRWGVERKRDLLERESAMKSSSRNK